MIYLAGTDFSHLTQDEKVNGIPKNKIPDYIRSKVYGVDVRETIAQSHEVIVDDFYTGLSNFKNYVSSELEVPTSEFWDNQFQDKYSDLERTYAEDLNLVKTRTTQTSEAKVLKPSFTLIDDDGAVGAINILKPMLDERGFRGSVAVITDRTLGTDGRYMRLADLETLHDAGWSLVSHTHNHIQVPTLTETEMRYQFRESKRLLAEWGFPTEHLVLPANAYNQQVLDVGREYFKTIVGAYAQGGDGLHVNEHPIPSLMINRVGIGVYSQNPSLSDLPKIKAEVDRTIETNGLLVFMTHAHDNTAEQNQLLEEVLDYIASKGQKVVSYDEAIAEHGNAIEKGDFDGNTKRFDFAIGADGTVDKAGIRFKRLSDNSVNNSTSPIYFEPDTEYYCRISEDTVMTFPFDFNGKLKSELIGNLYTNTIGYTVINYKITQIFYPSYSNEIYIRHSVSKNVWGAWNVIKSQLAVKPTFNALPSAYPSGTHTFNYQASESGDGLGGTLTTIKPSNTTDSYTYQTYKLANKDIMIYRSYSTTSGAWKAWVELTGELFSSTKLAFDAQADAYKIGQTRDIYTIDDVLGKSSPNNIGGVLTTVKPSSDLFYAYQTFKERGSNKFYLRSYIKPNPNTGIWSEWKEV